MSRLSQFFGPPSTKSIVPIVQDGWTTSATFPGTGASVTSGTTSNDTYVTLLDVDGKGWLDHLAFQSLSVTSRTITIRITIDGTVVWTSVSGTIASGTQGKYLLGINAASSQSEQPTQVLRFNSNITIEAKESIGTTGGMKLFYGYRLD